MACGLARRLLAAVACHGLGAKEGAVALLHRGPSAGRRQARESAHYPGVGRSVAYAVPGDRTGRRRPAAGRCQPKRPDRIEWMPHANVVSAITFAFPAMAWGAAACAAPVLIHLILRSRPRRQEFPAIRYLVASHRSSIRRHRLRHLLLLLLRVLVILMLMAALARPTYRGSWLSAQARDATAAVFLLDDSASMEYRVNQDSRLERARSFIRAVVEQPGRFPGGSAFALMTCRGGGDPFWLSRAQDLLELAERTTSGEHDVPLSSAIEQALRRLAESTLARRELYILTDQTARAWEGVAARRFADLENTAVIVLDAGHRESLDACIRLTSASLATLSAGSPLRLEFAIAAGNAPSSTRVEAHCDGVLIARTDTMTILAAATATGSIVVPALTTGVHGIELRMDAGDALACNDSVFVAVEVRPAPRVAVVRNAHTARHEAVEPARVAALLCPATLPEHRRPFEVVELDTAALPEALNVTRNGTAPFKSVVLVDLANWDAVMVNALFGYVQSGGLVIVIAGDGMTAPLSVESVLPGAFVDRVRPVDPTRIAVLAEPRTAGQTSGTELAALSESVAAPLASAAIYQYARIRPSAEAVSLAEFADGGPAILARRIGAGSVIQWAFSLDPGWSDLGIRAGPAVILLHTLLAETGAAEAHAATVACGQSVEVAAPTHMRGGRLKSRRSGGKHPSDGTETASRGEGGAPESEAHDEHDSDGLSIVNGRLAARLEWTAQGKIRCVPVVPGLYEVRVSGYPDRIAVCAANLHEAETIAERVDADAVRSFFAPDSAIVVDDPALLNQPTMTVAGDRDLEGYCFLLALLALLLEGLVANRFYRRSE